jgi:hypothetical protein
MNMRRNVGPVAPVAIVPEQTTMADVLLALGEPDRVSSKDGRTRMVWTAGHARGGVGGVLFGSGGHAAGGLEFVEYQRRIIVFDARGVVVMNRYDKRICVEGLGDFEMAWKYAPCAGRDWVNGTKE